MKSSTVWVVYLSIVGALLLLITIDPFLISRSVHAESAQAPNFFIEPGTTTLRSPDGDRQVTGKVVIDLRNGNVWGFPTLTDIPYPIDVTKSAPPVSHPMYLGRYDLAAMDHLPASR